MLPQFPEFRGIRRRVKRTLKYGIKPNTSLSAPMNDLVMDYFHHHSPYDYLRPDISANISHRGHADPFTFVVALVYLERVRATDKEFFESSDPADLYLPALVLASKFLYDPDVVDAASNADWAEVADITLSHMNTLEWDFVKRLDWDTMVKEAEFEKVLSNVETYVADHNLKASGIATYNELSQLGSAVACSSYMSVLRDFFSFIGVLGIVYTAAVCSMFAVPKTMQAVSTQNASASSASSVTQLHHDINLAGSTCPFEQEDVCEASPSSSVFVPTLPGSLGSPSVVASKKPHNGATPKMPSLSSFYETATLYSYASLLLMKQSLLNSLLDPLPFQNSLIVTMPLQQIGQNFFNRTQLDLCT